MLKDFVWKRRGLSIEVAADDDEQLLRDGPLDSTAELDLTYRAATSRGFDRNMNTGGKNYDQSKGVVACNAVHHSKQYPSELKITVVKK